MLIYFLFLLSTVKILMGFFIIFLLFFLSFFVWSLILTTEGIIILTGFKVSVSFHVYLVRHGFFAQSGLPHNTVKVHYMRMHFSLWGSWSCFGRVSCWVPLASVSQPNWYLFVMGFQGSKTTVDLRPAVLNTFSLVKSLWVRLAHTASMCGQTAI